ncbi:hypothetical protein DPMN_159371 [Dreissena polymorpha]|uniref:Uncharacterized protein n=1 Tax=Dreissena polymorpha TaxID=45954 RepID=A0A9D4EKM1_DREPO|nr:hypothetical protein DPMN_159371 [Dreissena polymorpha]
MLKLAQTNQQTNRQGKNNMSPTTIVGDIKIVCPHYPGLNVDKLVKKHTRKVESYISWVDKHCRQRHYAFQIRKCEDADCCTRL